MKLTQKQEDGLVQIIQIALCFGALLFGIKKMADGYWKNVEKIQKMSRKKRR